jgi:hypothetical protein
MLDRVPEADRSALLGELAELGRQRREAGVRLTEIARVTGVSRPALYAWRGCYDVRALGERAVG